MKTSNRSVGDQPLSALFPAVHFLVLLLVALVSSVAAPAQSNYEVPYIFTTIAGSPAGGSADGTGSSARFYLPKGIAVDAAGNSYVADTTNHTIRKITAAGAVTTLAGVPGSQGAADGTGSAARFYSPSGIAVDASGNVLVADTQNHTIRKIAPDGVVTTFAGAANQSGSADGTGSLARFFSPIGIAVDAAGNVYIGDTGNHTIRKITSLGVVTTLAGSAGLRNSTDGAGSVARFDVPQNLAVDNSGNVYVADANNNTVRKINPAGLVSTLAGAAGTSGSIDGTGGAARFSYPTGVAVDSGGNVFVADYRNCLVRRITSDGAVTTVAGLALSSGSTDGSGAVARFNFPSALAMDDAGNLYVVDTSNNVIRKINAGGAVSTFAGTALTAGSIDGTGTAAKFCYPSGVAVDGDGNTYVADTSASTIRKITREGIVTTLAGTAYNYGSADGNGSAASFYLPQDVAVDSAGNVYVADYLNCTIRKITSSGSVTTLAGAAGVFGSANGPGVYARFSYIHGIAVDGSGNVYVADTYNSMVRKITPAGMVTTLADSRDLTLPFDVAVDESGNVYVANTTGQTIRKISPVGVVTTLAGGAGGPGSADGTGTAARFNNPRRITVDGSGNVFVSDEDHTIRRITPGGVVTTIAGMAGQSGASDGTGSAALFNFPRGLAVDGAGDIYVADYYNHTIRKGTPTLIAPTITTQPVGQTVMEGSNVTLSVAATGSPSPAFQWRKNSVAIAGAISTSLALTNLQPGDTGNYDVLVSNSAGSATSASAFVTVNAFPAITNISPTSQQLTPGQTLNLGVSATGTGVLSYQWIHNGAAVAGATSATYSAPNIKVPGGGWYQVLITDAVATTRSPLMFVTVRPTTTQLLGWGYNGYHQIDIPSELNDAIAIATGYSFSLALKANGTVVGWGTGGNGEPTIPAGLAGVVAIATDSGGGHVLALKSDGTVVAWGNNYQGQCDIPAGLRNVVAIGAGSRFSVALRDDGTLAVWGTAPNSMSSLAAGLSGVVAISSSNNHLLALKGDGTIVAMGTNDYGENTVPVGLTNVIAVAAGRNHSLALKNDGTVVAWGWNYPLYGQTDVPTGLTGVVAIAAAADFSLAIKSDRTLVTWGDNGYGQRNIPSDLSDVLAVSGGDQFTLVLRDASADTVPAISSQPAGLSVLETSSAAFSVTASGKGPITYQWRKGGIKIVGATASTFTVATVVPADAGSYDVVITNHVGSTTSTSVTLLVGPLPVVTTMSSPRQVLLPGQSLNLNVAATGNGALSYQWIHNGLPINGATGSTYFKASASIQSSGWYVVLITDSIGTRRSAPLFVTVAPLITQVRRWGYEWSWPATVMPANLTDVIALDASGSFALALKRDGTVISWGLGGYGAPAGLSDVVAVAAGTSHALALKSDGTVVAWGGNENGESSVPVGLSDVVAVSAGMFYSLAVKSDGSVVGWGTGGGGAASVPAGLAGVIAISTGNYVPLALKNDGTAVSWGSLGNTVPNIATNLTDIAVGGNHSVALRNDGTVLAWGINGDGQTNVPAGLHSVVAVAAGFDQSLALKSDGSVVGWGNNINGAATPPTDLFDVFAISSGGYFYLALRDGSNDTSPVIIAPPVSQAVVEEQALALTVTVSGAGPMTYQWRKDGNDIPGATFASLTLSDVSLSAGGNYDVKVSNYLGSTTSAAATLVVNPIPIVTALSPNRQVVVPGGALSLSVVATGKGDLSYQWTHNGRTITDAVGSVYHIVNATASDSGWYRVLITDSNGTRKSALMFVNVAPLLTRIRGWGDATIGKISIPDGLTTATAISSSSVHSLALKRDGTIVGWGQGYYAEAISPTGLGGVVAVAIGASHSLALKSDGTVVAWGQNYSNQTSVPAGLERVVAIAAGGDQSVALKSDGTVVTWGSNSFGGVPAGLSGVIAVAAGVNHVMALKADGMVVVWGANPYGQTEIPAGLANVVAIASGDYHLLALKSDGTVVAWGRNVQGETLVPAGLSGVMAVAAGYHHSLALCANGTIVGWGNNASGQTTTPSDVANVIAISAGNYFSQALCDATLPSGPIISTHPISQSVGIDGSVTFTVIADGYPKPTYQWQKNGVSIVGATGSSYVIASVGSGDAGSYTVVVTNPTGSVTSNPAILETFIAPPGNAVITISVE